MAKHKPLKMMSVEERRAYNRAKANRSYQRKRNRIKAAQVLDGIKAAEPRALALLRAGANPDAYASKTVRLPLSLIARLNAAGYALKNSFHLLDQTAIVEKGLKVMLEVLETQHNGGKPFPMPQMRPRARVIAKSKTSIAKKQRVA